MEVRKYCDVENLYRSEEIYHHGRVIAKEKLHGANTRIGYVDGKVFLGGRNTIFTEFETGDYDAPVDVSTLTIENDCYGFTRWFLATYPTALNKLAGICKAVGQNYILFGEFIGPGIHKGVDYGPDKSFWVFDAWSVWPTLNHGGYWLDWNTAYEIAKAVGLKRVPTVYAGPPIREEFDKVYEMESVVGKELGAKASPNICEGVVIVPEIECRDEFGDRVIIKHKNDKFAEKKSEKKEPKPAVDMTAEQEYVDTYVVPERLNHVLQHLREDTGIEVKDMRYTKEVIAEMVRDLKKECQEWFHLDEKNLGTLVPKATVTLLKQYLAG